MKLSKDDFTILILVFMAVVIFVAINFYTSVYPIKHLSFDSLKLKNIETTVDQSIFNNLSNGRY